MKASFQLIATLILVVMLGMGAVGCGSDENAERSTMPAQQSDQGDPQPGQQSSTGSQMLISDVDLEKAAAAQVEIDKSNQQLQDAVQQTQNPIERQKLQEEAIKRMVQAVENAGLDFETYNNIMRIVNTNKELDKMFQEKVQNLR
jgi:hypothetical protein